MEKYWQYSNFLILKIDYGSELAKSYDTVPTSLPIDYHRKIMNKMIKHFEMIRKRPFD